MKKIICMIVTVTILLVSVSCSPNKTYDPASAELSVDSGTARKDYLQSEQNEKAISLDKFKSEITGKHLGEIVEVDGDYGYDAALVTAEDGTNYIYMYLADPDMARSVLIDSDGDGRMDPDFTLTTKGNGYELYTQESTEPESSDYTVYGRCLLAGSMILMVSGSMENREQIRKNADSFMKDLGYDLP